MPSCIEKYNACMGIIDYGSEECRRDTAFGMICVMIHAKNKHDSDWVDQLKLRVALFSMNSESMLDNVTEPVSSSTSIHYDYCRFPITMRFLAKQNHFNLETLYYIRERLDERLSVGGNLSPLAACCHNVYGNRQNRLILDDCIKVMEALNGK